MKRLARTGIFAAATAGVIVSGTLISYAGWIAPPSAATAKARAGSVPTGVTPSAAIQSGKAVVSWGAQEIVPGVEMTAYVVTAHDTDATPLPDVAHTVTASGAATESATFTAVELAGGNWQWAIIPKFQTWTGAEGKPTTAPVEPAPAAVETTTPAPGTKPVAPKADPTTTAPEKPVEPETTETPKADPTLSDSPPDPTPSPSSSTSRYATTQTD